MRVGWQGWSVWIVIVVIALAQCVLCGMAATFSIRKWKAQTREAGRHGEVSETGREAEVDERTGLLKGQVATTSRPSSRKL
jgi:phosphotransferase system  glucose/maltose/N-acetylglucosamine-specific IIC component